MNKTPRTYIALKQTCPKCGKDFLHLVELNHQMFDKCHHVTCQECGQKCHYYLEERIHIDIRRDDETSEERVKIIVDEWLDSLPGGNAETDETE